jgi:hypothetical protein
MSDDRRMAPSPRTVSTGDGYPYAVGFCTQADVNRAPGTAAACVEDVHPVWGVVPVRALIVEDPQWPRLCSGT